MSLKNSYLVIAIDGACRRNGKPDCVSSGGVFIEEYDEQNNLVDTKMLSVWEVESTNQRGELNALFTALDYIYKSGKPAQIITDSEYMFNTMTKSWCLGWSGRGWLTASGDPVKNSDLWKKIYKVYCECIDVGIEPMFYHIKGHCIPFGKVTANTLLSKDDTGKALLTEVYLKYDSVCKTSRVKELEAANELSNRNNGFKLTEESLRHFVVINTMADAIATKCVDAADSLMIR